MAKKKRRRRIRKGALLFVVVVFLGIIALIYFLISNITFIKEKSIHADALKYKEKSCLVFYPNSNIGKDKAKEICSKTNEEKIYDYALIPYGDYYEVSYSDGTSYFVDKKYNELVIPSISSENGKRIISDYLRYSMKKDEIDEAYTYDFLNCTYYQNIDLSNASYKIKGDDLAIYFNTYSYEVNIPLKYIQSELNINLGYKEEEYIKPRYVSKNRKMICFTFDDGPDLSFKTSGQIVDDLYKYDSSSTFFVLGNRLGEKQIAYIKGAASKDMEYGSHTQSHKNLTKLSLSDAKNEILTPYNDLYNGFGYEMKYFRPPYGSVNNTILEATNLRAILWNVDSLDWSYRDKYSHDECVETIYNKVLSEADENDVVLFHDIYQTTADAVSKIIEHYIKDGYQIVSAGELINALGVTANRFGGK